MRKIILGFTLLFLTGCGPTMFQATSYEDFRNQTLSKGFQFTAEAYSDTLQMNRGGMGGSNNQFKANQLALEQCAKVASDCIITRENNNVVRTTKIQIQNELNEAKSKEIEKIIQKRDETENKLKIARAEQEIKKQNELKLIELKKIYSGKCNLGFTKETEKYNNCLLEQEKKDLAEQKKKQDLADANRKKSEAEAKQISERLAKMNPDDRRAYTCSEKFGFRKGSDKFKDCIFELYKAENELEKIQLQKQVAQANLEAAKARESAARSSEDQRLALMQRQTRSQEMQGLAALQQAREAEFSNSMALINQGLSMMSPQRSAPAPMRTCSFNGRFMNCF